MREETSRAPRRVPTARPRRPAILPSADRAEQVCRHHGWGVTGTSTGELSVHPKRTMRRRAFWSRLWALKEEGWPGGCRVARIDRPTDRTKGETWQSDPFSSSSWGSSTPTSTARSSPSSSGCARADTVRVIDSLAVYKDSDGEIEVEHLSNLTESEAIELGSKVGALIGLGIEGEEGMEAGAVAGAEAAADGIEVFSDEQAWDVLEEIPNDSAAALILLEHHWAVPLRDAIARAGGFRISDGFISPLDLVGIGLMSAAKPRSFTPMKRPPPETP